MKRELTKRELILYGLPVLSLIVAGLVYFLIVSPEKSRASNLASQVVGAQAALLAAHQKPPKPVSAHAVQLYRLTTAMPDAADMPGLLLDLTRLAQSSKVTLQSVTPSAQVPLASDDAALPVDVIVDGTFPNVTGFLSRLRHQVSMTKQNVHATGRLVITNEVQLSSTDGRTVAATLDLDAFVYGAGTPAAATPTTTTTGS